MIKLQYIYSTVSEILLTIPPKDEGFLPENIKGLLMGWKMVYMYKESKTISETIKQMKNKYIDRNLSFEKSCGGRLWNLGDT